MTARKLRPPQNNEEQKEEGIQYENGRRVSGQVTRSRSGSLASLLQHFSLERAKFERTSWRFTCLGVQQRRWVVGGHHRVLMVEGLV